MSRTHGGTEKVSAVMGADGKVYFEFRPVTKPSRMPLPDWMLVCLSVLVAAGVTALALLI